MAVSGYYPAIIPWFQVKIGILLILPFYPPKQSLKYERDREEIIENRRIAILLSVTLHVLSLDILHDDIKALA